MAAPCFLADTRWREPLLDDPAADLAPPAWPRRRRLRDGSSCRACVRVATGPTPGRRGMAAGHRGRSAGLHCRVPEAARLEGLPREHAGRPGVPRPAPGTPDVG